MQITLDERTGEYLQAQAKAAGFTDASEYIASLVHGDWKRRLGERLGIKPEDHVRIIRELEEGYEENAERDRQIAEEWFPLEEEAWNRDDSTT